MRNVSVLPNTTSTDMIKLNPGQQSISRLLLTPKSNVISTPESVSWKAEK
jgi:hypothetical protein